MENFHRRKNRAHWDDDLQLPALRRQRTDLENLEDLGERLPALRRRRTDLEEVKERLPTPRRRRIELEEVKEEDDILQQRNGLDQWRREDMQILQPPVDLGQEEEGELIIPEFNLNRHGFPWQQPGLNDQLRDEFLNQHMMAIHLNVPQQDQNQLREFQWWAIEDNPQAPYEDVLETLRQFFQQIINNDPQPVLPDPQDQDFVIHTYDKYVDMNFYTEDELFDMESAVANKLSGEISRTSRPSQRAIQRCDKIWNQLGEEGFRKYAGDIYGMAGQLRSHKSNITPLYCDWCMETENKQFLFEKRNPKHHVCTKCLKGWVDSKNESKQFPGCALCGEKYFKSKDHPYYGGSRGKKRRSGTSFGRKRY